MNVAYVAMAPFISGSERCLQLILTHCHESDIQPILIAPQKSPMHAWAEQQGIQHFSCELVVFDKKRPWRWLFNQFKMLRILQKNNIEVVHSNQIWSYRAMVWPSSLLNIKRVCHFRDPVHEGSKWWLNKPLDTAICISDYIAEQYTSTIDATLATKVETIIDPVIFHSALSLNERAAVKQAAKQKLATKPERFIFGFIGQVAPIKGVLELIALLAHMKTHQWQLIIAGKDPSYSQAYMQKCQVKVVELGLEDNINFIGFIDNTRDFYLAVDTVVMLSKEEPLGLIPLEAAVHYTPTIASKVGGLPETIIDGKTGWLVDLGTPDNIIEKLNNVIDEDLVSVGQAAREWVESVSLPSVHCAKLKKIYK